MERKKTYGKVEEVKNNKRIQQKNRPESRGWSVLNEVRTKGKGSVKSNGWKAGRMATQTDGRTDDQKGWMDE